MIKFNLNITICATALLLFSNSVNAALITNITGLDIGGTLYDVTFHSGTSFNSLWNADGDGVFGNDASLFNLAPTFWEDKAGADVAAVSVMAALSNTDWTAEVEFEGSVQLWDSFYVPYDGPINVFGSPGNHVSTDNAHDDLGVDVLGSSIVFTFVSSVNVPYLSFALSNAAPPAVIPVPSAVWLFGSGLLGLVGVVRRKKA